MPQKPRFLRKMMSFDGGVRVCASATLRCTRKYPCDIGRGGIFLCVVSVSRDPTEFGLTLAQPCALRTVALTVHQPDTRPQSWISRYSDVCLCFYSIFSLLFIPLFMESWCSRVHQPDTRPTLNL